MDEWQFVGSHRVRSEEDILFLRFIGDMSLEDTRAMADLQEQIIAKHGHVFVITDLHQGGVFSSAGRRYLGEWNKKFWVDGVAQYGGSRMCPGLSCAARH